MVVCTKNLTATKQHRVERCMLEARRQYTSKSSTLAKPASGQVMMMMMMIVILEVVINDENDDDFSQ